MVSGWRNDTWSHQGLNWGSWREWRWWTCPWAKRGEADQLDAHSAATRTTTLTKWQRRLTFFTFPGVGVPGTRLLVGVLTEVPYNMSSWVCLVFFCCYLKKRKNHIHKTLLWQANLRFKHHYDLPSPVSPSPSPRCVEPTAAARTQEIPARSPGTLCRAPAPTHQFGPSDSFPAIKQETYFMQLPC